MATEGLPVKLACRVLQVSESGYYARRSRPPSVRSIRHVWLTDLIRQAHAASRGTHGIRRVHAEFTLGHGVAIGLTALEWLVRRAGIQGICGRPKFRRVSGVATASDRVARQFHRDHPDELWVTDVTEHPTREGKVYCAVVLDAWSRRVIGWSIESSPTTALVTNALGMAIDQRRPSESNHPIHVWAFTRRAMDSGLLPSMGSVGDCFDNALMEAFWSRMQVELLDRQRWST